MVDRDTGGWRYGSFDSNSPYANPIKLTQNTTVAHVYVTGNNAFNFRFNLNNHTFAATSDVDIENGTMTVINSYGFNLISARPLAP